MVMRSRERHPQAPWEIAQDVETCREGCRVEDNRALLAGGALSGALDSPWGWHPAQSESMEERSTWWESLLPYSRGAGVILPVRPLPPARGSGGLGQFTHQEQGAHARQPCPLPKLGKAGSLPIDAGNQENPAAPMFLLSVNLHCQLHPKPGPHHQITRPSVFEVEMIVSAREGPSEIHVKHLAQCPANKEHAVSSDFSHPVATGMCVLCLLSFHEILGNALKLGVGLHSYPITGWTWQGTGVDRKAAAWPAFGGWWTGERLGGPQSRPPAAP